MNAIDKYLNEHIEGIALRPPLFYNWPYGIRFEISMPWADHAEADNLRQIKERSLTIFTQVFSDTDEMMLVADVSLQQKKQTNLFKKYVKHKAVLRKLQHRQNAPYNHRYLLPCTKADIRFGQLLSFICDKDFVNKGYDVEIYVVNVARKMIFHLYDDSGCDVIAVQKEELLPLYSRLNQWVLENDRSPIDQMFQQMLPNNQKRPD
ncbi:DUF3885 domain-containing protein [Bacillus sonorensis]|uniref:DUF3885 domain-containing protein n=1 Tax=Bacillus sonorensis TaxID=119858 RepID=UPI00227DB6D9|nr:DUF3885 domain-containing protein [Bacillus sonorensis]MCZ0070841.1 DUF3885 domain-containing protein [Bacillus sonorensis]MCZ0098082.1 DUF3885 domain-containing protein [Bacillus sonorensis]MEC1519608.1 DUF3885 domain-containing protein [Bacillus sonorensis]